MKIGASPQGGTEHRHVAILRARGTHLVAARLFSGYRDYPEDVLDRLEFIKEAKGLGFTLREIKELLSMGVSRHANAARHA